MKTLSFYLFCVCSAASSYAADSAMSATDIAARLSILQQDGSALIHMRMEAQQPGSPKIALQFQIKQRRTKSATEVVYQVLWPKDRAGEAVLLRKAGRQAGSGTLFVPPGTLRTLESSQMKEPMFGSDLTYADVVENFYSWEKQTLAGTETAGRVSCQILESKPGRSDSSIYAMVRSWVDTRRFVPMRVEKYLAGGRLARRIETTRVASDDEHRSIPANLTVHGSRPDAFTELEGSKIKHGVAFEDREFTPAGLKDASQTHSVSE